MDIIYLDNAATTRVANEVQHEMTRADNELYYNSAALYNPSLNVKKAIEQANKTIKSKIDKSGSGTLVFTSGATEGNNMVIFGKITNTRQHLLVLSGEHSSVYAPSVYLKNNGYDVDYVPLLADGQIDINALKTLIRPNTALFVFGMVNSDTGTMQNAGDIAKTVRAINPKVHIHCDAVQAFAKFDFDVSNLGLDSATISAHKINGPKGIGALWLKKGVALKPIMYGGSQQDYRPGTENNTAIIGFAKAAEVFNTAQNYDKVKTFHSHLINNLPDGCKINGNNLNPYITNIQLPNILGSTVMNALSARGIYVGLGSACAATAAKNRTLLAMNIPEQKTKQVLRVSLGAYNTQTDVTMFTTALKEILAKRLAN